MPPHKNPALALVTSTALAASNSVLASTKLAPTEPKLSVQLWSVRDALSADFEGTLTQLKAYGFQGVEFAGSFGKYDSDAHGLKQFLDNIGLKASSAHVNLAQFLPENFAATVAFYQALECNLLIVPMDERAATLNGAKALAKDLSEVEAKLAPLGMHTGYHNHKMEMLDLNETTPWDVIAQNTPAGVVLQQDVGWTEVAGKNPVDIVKKYPGRTIVTHYKAAAPEPGNKENPIIGKDSTDWKALIVANRTFGGTQWLVVEQEIYAEGLTALQSVEASLKGLQKEITELDNKK